MELKFDLQAQLHMTKWKVIKNRFGWVDKCAVSFYATHAKSPNSCSCDWFGIHIAKVAQAFWAAALITRITLVALATELWQRREIRSYIKQINILIIVFVHNLLVVFYMPSERDLLVRRLRSFSRLPNRFMSRNNDGGLKYELICTFPW